MPALLRRSSRPAQDGTQTQPGKTWKGQQEHCHFQSLGGWLSLEILQAIVNGPTGAIAIHECLLYGLVLSVAGMIGDLVESLLKRDAAVKDLAAARGWEVSSMSSIRLVAAGVAYVLVGWVNHPPRLIWQGAALEKFPR